MANGKGGITALESMKQGWGQGQAAAPDRDFEQRRFGPNTPASSIDLRDKTTLLILEACGVPAGLFTSEGGAQRETYRHFLTGTCQTLANMIAHELREKLELPNLNLYFPQLVQSDSSARSRSLAAFVTAGLTLEGALRIMGLEKFIGDIAPTPSTDDDDDGFGA